MTGDLPRPLFLHWSSEVCLGPLGAGEREGSALQQAAGGISNTERVELPPTPQIRHQGKTDENEESFQVVEVTCFLLLFPLPSSLSHSNQLKILKHG